MKSKGIKWLATVTTVSEAKTAESAGADIIVAQGMEAGGHRGAFDATQTIVSSGAVGPIASAQALATLASGHLSNAVPTCTAEAPNSSAAARFGRTNLSEPAPNAFNMNQSPRPPKDIPNEERCALPIVAGHSIPHARGPMYG